MTQTTLARSDQLQAWVLSSYQRLERLRAPAFSPGLHDHPRQTSVVEDVVLRSLPMEGLPRELCPIGDWLDARRAPASDLTDEVRLSLFFKYLAAPLRYEPLSESRVHKATPSSRGRYPLKYFLLQAQGGRTRVYVYVPEFHALRECAELAAPGLQDGQSALICVGRAWRYAEEYGEFAYMPCVLEAGHALAQSRHLAALLGIADTEDPDRTLGRAFCARAFEVPLFGIGLRLVCDLDRLESRRARIGDPRPYDDTAQRFPRLALFQRCFDAGASPPRADVDAAADAVAATAGSPQRERGVLEVMRRRTSSNLRGGVSAVLSTLPAGTLASLLATWRAIRRRRARTAAEELIVCSLIWLANEAGQPPGILDIDGRPLPGDIWRGDLRESAARMLPHANARYNLSTHAAIVIIQVDIMRAIERFGDAALRETHLAAGAAAQDFSLAASAHDLFSRPVKMMREARLESSIAVQGQPLYVVLCGRARSSNPTMDLF